MRNRIVLTMAISWIILCSCKTEPDLVPNQKKGENFTFYTSQELYSEAIGKRLTDTGNSFTIKSVESMKDDPSTGHDLLKITVSHPASCDGKFEFIWDGAIMESYPEQVNIFLRLSGSCPDDGPIVETVLHLDVDAFIGGSDLADRALFHIINGSVSSGDEDMSVSFP